MKLTPRLTLVFILYASVLLLGFGLLAYNSGRDALRNATLSELQATAQEKEAALNKWIEDNQAGIGAVASDPTIINLTSSLRDSAPDSQEYQAAHDGLVKNLEPYISNDEFFELSLIHPESGQILASTDPAEEGKFKEDREYFLKGKQALFVQNLYYSIPLQTIAMTASAPLKTSHGELLGVLSASVDLETMNSIISRRTGLHTTDDVYLVNPSSVFVTEPRFIDSTAAMQREVQTEAIDQCLQKRNGWIEAQDYRNVPTFEVYRWLPEHNVCLIVGIDQTEAYRPIRTFGGTIAAISALALAAAAAVAFALARSLTRPILALQEGAARFGRGELGVRLNEVSKDELGQLAAEFNQMAEALENQQAHLRQRSEQFFNLSPDLLCTIDSAGRMQDPNPSWEQILGYSREELMGRFLTNFVHPDDVALTLAALKQIASEESGRFEIRFRHIKGSYRWLAWVVVRSTTDRILYAAARDITERQVAEEKLRQQTEELERSNRELEEFAYVASHDLQEPLRLVVNHVQLLARRYHDRLDQDADEFIDFAMEGANRLKSLISDLLAYSKIGARGNAFAAVEMAKVYDQVTENLQAVITDSKASMTYDSLPVILGDNEQMVQLLQNLIDNSIKFRGKEPPHVHVGARQLSENWLIFVRDNGIGIDPQYTEKVFVIFQRLHSRDEYPGTGIGLSICRKIIERHGGHIWVDSEPGKGATFNFTLRPVDGWSAKPVPPGREAQRPKDTIADRASDLI